MITVEVRPSVALLNKQETSKSLFVNIDYNLDTYDKIRRMPRRVFHPESEEWEIPTRNLEAFLLMFQSEKLTLRGTIEKRLQKKINAVARFDDSHLDPDSYQFKTKPFQHQIDGFHYGLQNQKFILGDQQGLGKTFQASNIAVARKGMFKYCLIVCCVNGLKYNWIRDIEEHTNEQGRIIGSYIGKKGDIRDGTLKDRLADLQSRPEEFFLITNVETLRDKAVVEELEKMTESGEIGMVVVDEFHRGLKTGSSLQGKSIHKLKSYYKIALTGTPMVNEPEDFHNLLKWIDADKRTLEEFRDRFYIMVNGENMGIREARLDELRQLVQQHMLRRLKSDCLDLPEKVRKVEYVELKDKQKKLYEDILDSIKKDLDRVRLVPNPLAEMINLRKCTAHTSLVSSKISESAKMSRLVELVDESVKNGEKVIVFSTWREVTKLAREELARYNPAYVDSQTRDRMAEIDKLQNDDDCSVIIGTVGTLGTGYNLTKASHVIFLDSPWSPANKEQAEDRAHRIGQKGTVTVTTIVTKHTIDEYIEEILKEKGDISSFLVDGKLDMRKADKEETIQRLLGLGR